MSEIVKMSSVFSPLAHGYGSWDGDLEQKLEAEAKKTKLVLSKSFDGESYDHLEKKVNIPIRIKSQLSQIKTILQEASKSFPNKTQNSRHDPHLVDTILFKTEGTEYSRPQMYSSSRPRTGIIRADKRQVRPTLGRSHRLHHRARSAPVSRQQSRSSPSPGSKVTLPKTLTTRKGALMLFAAPGNIAFSQPEQKCYFVDPNAVDLDTWASNLRTVKTLASSVLKYGSEYADEFEPLTSDDAKACVRFLHKQEDERGVDYRLQPGGDFVFYLKDVKTKQAVRNVVSSLSQRSASSQEDRTQDEENAPEQVEEGGRMELDELDGERPESTRLESALLRPAKVRPQSQTWASKIDSTSGVVTDGRSQSQGSVTTETTVRFASDHLPQPSSVSEMSLMTRPDTARSTRSAGSIRSATPLSFKDLAASIKSAPFLGRGATSPYSPHQMQPSLPHEEEEEDEEYDDDEEEEDGDDVDEVMMDELGDGSIKSRSRQSSRQSSHPRSRASMRSASQRSHHSDHPGDEIPSRVQSAASRRSRASSARSRKSSAGVRSNITENADGMEEEEDDWRSEDLAELGLEDLEPGMEDGEILDVGEVGDEADGEAVPGSGMHRSQSRASSQPPRMYTPQTRSSRHSTPPPDGDEWPGLEDGAVQDSHSRPASGVARTSSAKSGRSRQSARSRPGTSGSSRTVGFVEDTQEEIQEEPVAMEMEENAAQDQISGDDPLQLAAVGEGLGLAREVETPPKSPSVPSRPSTRNTRTPPPNLQPQEPPDIPSQPVTQPETPKPVAMPTIAPPIPPVHHTPTPPPPRVKSAVPKEKGDGKAGGGHKTVEKIGLGSLQPTPAKKPSSSIPKPEKRSSSPKAASPRSPRKGRKGKKGRGSSPDTKHKMEFIEGGGGTAYDEPSQDEVDKMIQEELAKELAEAKISLEVEETKEEDKDPNDVDRVSVATDDEAIEKEIKQQTKGTKKSKKQLAKERVALKEARRQEKQRREEEKRALQEKRKAAEEEKRRAEYEEMRKKQEIEEQLQEAEYEARMAKEAEEEARQMLQESRKAAREEREKKRKEEMERKKEERERQREERRKMEEAARQREREMAERLADAAERRRLREEAEWEAEEREREEREAREREEEEERRRMEEEEERIRELERQAEQEALERLARERREAEEKMQQAKDDAERQKREEEQKMIEELKRLAEEEERRKQQEREEERKRQEELEKICKIQQLEEEARARVQRELDRRRAWALRRRDRNCEHRDHLNGLRNTQGMTRPWVFSYYVHWPRDTYEKRLPSKDKKKRGFRPKPKPVPPPPAPAEGQGSAGQATTGSG